MRLGITGSRYGHPQFDRWAEEWVARHGQPELWVVGDNEDSELSVDWQAYLYCRARGYPVMRVLKDARRPSPARFRERNQMMVDIVRVEPGGAFLAFPCARSRGTWDCVRRAEAALTRHRCFVNRALLGHGRQTVSASK